MAIVFTEKCCSHCGKLNWDSDTGGYKENCNAKGREDKKCDDNGEVRNYDENGKRAY